MSRPFGTTKYNQAIAEKIAMFRRLGCSEHYSALSSGISQSTLIRWKERYPEFRQLLEESHADSVVINLARLNRAAENGSVQAATWLLSKIAPELYSDRLDINLRVDVSVLSDEELDLIAAGKSIKLLDSPGTRREGEEEESQEASYTVLDQ